ncbi:Pex19 protein family [Colletotrichum higginsianum]|uniref:Pex19 protein family n=1 Tax=Colletotrichum higginsianum (strain IMI 349063) TaxID=759273 RepID=H1V5U6_COLHI|nr:Pex19 protein family [Colletotrichum higginsianum IMI 349063]OBR07302.1 Pex19 protein family [Colletotrichum higginsianum IMI 349063]CCF35598.1 Pex19 protein family [Colletotrichum higginsianum]
MEKDGSAAGAGTTGEAKPVVPAVEEKRPADVVDDVPDPDEDDLDDLDDMLDDFAAVNVNTKKPEQPVASSASGPGKPAAVAEDEVDEKTLEEMLSSDDFAKQLQAGMADLIGEFEKNVENPPSRPCSPPSTDLVLQPEMQAQFDNVFKQISAATGEAGSSEEQAHPRPTSSSSKAPASDPIADGSFQETIKKTMERMQASGQQATAAAAESSTEDLLAEMMKQFGEGNMEGGGGSEEEFSKMLMGMMEQLTNKEILYEPMKELNDKFPEWFEKNRAKTPAEDLKRYEEQQALVKEIVAKFEEKTYADSNSADREYIVDRMQKMQAAGSPPSDLVGDMPSAQDAFNGDESCNPQ